SSARASRRLVSPLMAETTTTISSPPACADATLSATALMRSTLPTEVPPYFSTIIATCDYPVTSPERARIKPVFGSQVKISRLLDARGQPLSAVVQSVVHGTGAGAPALGHVGATAALAVEHRRELANEVSGVHARHFAGGAGDEHDLAVADAAEQD